MKASIVIRVKNEEKWIGACLDAVFRQEYDNFDVIVVDNNSTDNTLVKARKMPVKIINVERYRPGFAINEGVRHCDGEIVVCLSGHCIPVNENWLATLVRSLADDEIAGVYGRQRPMSFTTDRDKRDLLSVFGLDSRVQEKDPFFHNANSAIKRSVWERIDFDEDTPHIEDRIWAHQVLLSGYKIYYDADAAVYHYHGIHQDDDPARRRRVVQVMENMAAGSTILSEPHVTNPPALSPADLNTVALIPVKGGLTILREKPLLWYTIQSARRSRYVNRTIVLADNGDVADYAKSQGAEAPFLRPAELSEDFIGVTDVLKFGLEELEAWDIHPDVCVVLEETYPFRATGLIDEMTVRLLREGVDSVIAVKPEFRSIWVQRPGGMEVLSPLAPRKMKQDEFLISLFGLGFVTYPGFIKDGSLGLEHSYAHRVSDPLSFIEVRDGSQTEVTQAVLSQYWATSRGEGPGSLST